MQDFHKAQQVLSMHVTTGAAVAARSSKSPPRPWGDLGIRTPLRAPRNPKGLEFRM